MRQRVEQVLTLEGLGDHALNVIKPRADVPRRGLGAGVAPAVAVDQAVAGDQYGGTCCISDTGQRLGTLGLAVFVKRHGRLDAALGIVNRLAIDMPEQGVEGATRQFAAILHVKKCVVCLDVRKAVPPVGLLNATKLFALDLGDDASGLIGVFDRRCELGQCRVHRLRQQLLTQAWGVRWATVVGDPL